MALALLLLNQPAMGGDDDEDDGGPGFRSGGGTCNKACTLGALPPVSAGTYVNNWPVRSLEKICNSSTSLTTAQVSHPRPRAPPAAEAAGDLGWAGRRAGGLDAPVWMRCGGLCGS